MKKILIFVLLMFAINAIAEQSISIYYPTTKSGKRIEKILKTKLNGYKPIMFARYTDFLDYHSRSEIVIAPSTFEKTTDQYEKILGFHYKGPTFKFQILGLNKHLGKHTKKNWKVGIVNFQKRKEMKKHLSLLMNQQVKRIKTVAKPVDLVPLLVFKAVDVILVSPRNLHEVVKDRNLILLGETKEMSHPFVYVKKGMNKDKIKKALQGLSKNELSELSFTGIQ